MVNELEAFYSPSGIVTLDTGITSVDGINHAKELGIEVFVTDHHTPQEKVPDCDIINPHLDAGIFHELCGAGVIYATLLSVLGENKDALQYAAIGTICDVVPVTHDNRYIIKAGLSLLSGEYANKSITNTAKGLRVQLDNEKTIAWYFGPAINAASRLNKINIAFDAYVNGNIESAKKLKKLNEERKRITRKTATTVETVVDGDVVIAASKDGKMAMAGLTAGHMAHDKHKPVCVCVKSGALFHCSIRTLGIINAVDYIEQSEYVNGGGHAAAAGFSVRTKNFDEFTTELSEFVRDNQVSIQPDVPDIEIKIQEAVDIYEKMLTMSPYGQNFKEPIFLTRNVNITVDMLTYTANGHLKIMLSSCNMYYYNPPNQSFVGKFDISYTLSYNTWQRKVTPIVEEMEGK